MKNQKERLNNLKIRFQEGVVSKRTAIEIVSEILGISKSKAEAKVTGWEGKLSSNFVKGFNRRF